MREPRAYRGADGTVTYRVRLRHRGRQTSETFPTLAAAKVFCRDLDQHGVEYAVKRRQEASELEWQSRGAKLNDVAEAFFAWKAPRVRAEKTVADYRRVYEGCISPRFGDQPIDTIRPADVQRWVEDMSAGKVTGKKLSAKTVQQRYTLLHSIVKYAMHPSRALAERDPCLAIDLPRAQSRPPKGLMPAEWQALHAALRQIDPDADDIAQFMLATGWRWSEAAGLAVGAVESLGGQTWVNMSQVVRRGPGGAATVVADGKSSAALRRVQVDADTARLIHRRCIGKAPADLVFTTARGAMWSYPNFRRRAWDQAVQVANLSRTPTPHWLRHTHVGWMILAGAGLPELQARIGHSSIQTTIGVYGRMISDVKAPTVDAFTRIRDGLPSVALEAPIPSNLIEN